MFKPLPVIALLLMCALAPAQTTRPTPEPTRVTVKLKDATIEQACKELSRVSGIPLRLAYQKQNPPRINLDFTNAPLLEVLAEFMRQAPAAPTDHSATLSYRFYPYEAVRYELIEPTVLAIIRSVQMEATSSADPAAKLRYHYIVQMTLVFDPSRQIVATSRVAGIDELVYANATPLQGSPNNPAPDQIDARRLGVYEFELRFATDAPIERIDKARLRVRAWQTVESAELNFVDAQLIEGGKQESKGVTAEMLPQSAKGSLTIKLTGEPIKQYAGYPWSQGLGSMLSVDNPLLPIDTMVCQVQSRPDGMELKLGLDQESDRQALDLLVQLQLRIPLKVRLIDVPIELRDIPMPTK